MIRSQRTPRTGRALRGGVAIVEGAVVLGVFLLILLGSLDIALAVLRSNALAEGARCLARAAVVRGADSGSIHSPWGPAPCAGTADDSTEFAAAVRNALVVVNRRDVRLKIEWPDGVNSSGNRVSATLSMSHTPLIASLFGTQPYQLRATSTMRIEH